MRIRFAALTAGVWLALAAPLAQAGWIYGGNQLSFTPGASHGPSACPDGSGGVYVAWTVDSAGTPLETDIRLQRYDATGNPVWPANGVVVCSAPGSQFASAIASDDSGGVFVAWEDHRLPFSSSGIYAQRVGSAGIAMWAPNGVQVGVPRASAFPAQLVAVADRHTGVYLAWRDFGSTRDTTSFVCAQRVDWQGVSLWAVGGSPCGFGGSVWKGPPAIDSHATNGLTLAWEESYGLGSGDVRGQRMGLDGSQLWAPNGLVICNAAGEQSDVALDDWSGLGTAVAWYDTRNLANRTVYLQRIAVSGAAQWTPNGVATPLLGAFYPAILTEGSCVFVSGSGTPLAFERLESNGVVSWPTPAQVFFDGGIAPRLVSDAAGGAMVLWHLTTGGDSDIYSRRMGSDGVPVWGFAFRLTLDDVNNEFPAVTSDTEGGAYVAWNDSRTGVDQIYLSRVNSSGNVPTAVAPGLASGAIALGLPHPQPSRGNVRLSLRLPERDEVSARIVDVAGRTVRDLLAPTVLPAGEHELRWAGDDARGTPVAAGLYFVQVAVHGVTTARRIVHVE